MGEDNWGHVQPNPARYGVVARWSREVGKSIMKRDIAESASWASALEENVRHFRKQMSNRPYTSSFGNGDIVAILDEEVEGRKADGCWPTTVL